MRIRREVRGVIFDIKNGEIFILLIQKLFPGYIHPKWRLVKGGIKKGESEEDALRREVREEVGLENLEITYKLSESSFCLNNVKHEISAYSVRTNMENPINYNQKEVWKYCWFPLNRVIGKLHLRDEKEDVRCLEILLCGQYKE